MCEFVSNDLLKLNTIYLSFVGLWYGIFIVLKYFIPLRIFLLAADVKFKPKLSKAMIVRK